MPFRRNPFRALGADQKTCGCRMVTCDAHRGRCIRQATHELVDSSSQAAGTGIALCDPCLVTYISTEGSSWGQGTERTESHSRDVSARRLGLDRYPTFYILNGYRRNQLLLVRPMTLEKARVLNRGQRVWFYANDRTARQYTINGLIKVWRRDPSRIRIPIKYGMYEYGYITEVHFTNFQVGSPLVLLSSGEATPAPGMNV